MEKMVKNVFEKGFEIRGQNGTRKWVVEVVSSKVVLSETVDSRAAPLYIEGLLYCRQKGYSTVGSRATLLYTVGLLYCRR